MLRQKTQRRLFRVVFLTGCVLPTLAIGAWAAARLHPAYHETILRVAGASMGVALECDDIATPKPGEYVVQGLRLADPVTGNELARCNFMRVTRQSGRWRFVADQVTVSPQGDAKIATPSKGGELPSVEGRIASLVAVDDNGAELCRWNRLHCHTGAPESLPDLPFDVEGSLLAAFWTESDNLSSMTALTISEDDRPQRRFTLQTGSVPLPCSLVPSVMPGPIARSTTFSGTIKAAMGNDLRGEATGTLRFQPFASSSASWSTAEVELIEMRWSGRRIESLHARADARAGLLSRNLVYGLYTMLGCQPRQALVDLWESAPDEQPVPYGRLACEVRLDPQGLVLFGRCGEQDGERRGGAIAHAVLAQGEEPLLIEPRERPQAISRIVRAFWPDAEPELPASAAAQEVASRLPLPAETETR